MVFQIMCSLFRFILSFSLSFFFRL
ncbi:hypothetical protein PanWU01x14_366560 [Parasponia andersonii]|uniref:Uncharacterized protein n=1 Tax=Parasponia andersonii TaxID=3476 RepID=A0A2P5A5L1_PARAD|nr:hypothetical protein PanWU01x14_366560 [Parasponia andersonii]